MSKLRSSLFACLFAAAIVPGCTKQHNPAACIQGHCSDPSLPFCDLDGAVAGEPNTCISVDCTPGEFDSCFSPNEALVCDTAGTSLDHNHCELGCDDATGCITSVTTCEPGTVMCGDRVVETCGADGHFSSQVCDVSCIDGPAPHCSYLSPKYLPDVCDTLATADHLDLGPFNTDIDSQCNGGIVAQTDGPSICVVRYSTITVPAGIEAKITGHRALALVADASLDILGALDVSADGTVSGPGGGLVDRGDAATIDGAGGGGFGESGGAGGSSGGAGGAANGGAPVDFAGPTFLGGSGNQLPPVARVLPPSGSGCTGQLCPPAPTVGGGGGGAVLAVACRGRIEVSGTIDAGGGGGGGGNATAVASLGGGGGGSGGNVFMAGLDVVLTGRLYANGGGGGNGGPGMSGRDAQRSAAAGIAVSTAASEGAGGAGSTISVPAGNGARASANYYGHGGGGGGMGTLRVATPEAVTAALNAAESSPRPMIDAPASVR